MPEFDIPRMEVAIADMLPSQESVVDDDGWLFRFNTGKSRNTNSVWPLTAAPESLESRIESCERVYAERDLPCNFRLTDLDEDQVIESFLLGRGYRADISMIVMVRPITEVTEVELPEIDLDGWLDTVQRLDDHVDPGDRDAKYAALSELPLPTWYTTIVRDGRVCSYGRTIQVDDLYQLAELFTVPDLRGQGLGTQLIHGLMKIGKEAGAQTAFMQGVTDVNTGARRLYERLGFQERYRFRYMTKGDLKFV